MPTYRYRCEKCGDDFEVWQSIKDDAFTTHEGECGGHLVKVLSPAGIVLKGSGFYKTDNRSSSRRSSEKADTSSSSSSSESNSSDSGGSSASSSETKSSSDTKADSGAKKSPAKTTDAKKSA